MSSLCSCITVYLWNLILILIVPYIIPLSSISCSHQPIYVHILLFISSSISSSTSLCYLYVSLGLPVSPCVVWSYSDYLLPVLIPRSSTSCPHPPLCVHSIPSHLPQCDLWCSKVFQIIPGCVYVVLTVLYCVFYLSFLFLYSFSLFFLLFIYFFISFHYLCDLWCSRVLQIVLMYSRLCMICCIDCFILFLKYVTVS